jgi:hypothetical protein
MSTVELGLRHVKDPIFTPERRNQFLDMMTCRPTGRTIFLPETNKGEIPEFGFDDFGVRYLLEQMKGEGLLEENYTILDEIIKGGNNDIFIDNIETAKQVIILLSDEMPSETVKLCEEFFEVDDECDFDNDAIIALYEFILSIGDDDEETKPTIEETKPTIEETKPTIEETKPTIEETKRSLDKLHILSAAISLLAYMNSCLE